MLGVIVAGALGGCGSSGSPAKPAPARGSLAAGCRAANAGDETATAAAYVFLLHMGSEEKMLMISPAEAKAKHITSGELMVGGTMSAGMPSGAMSGHTTMRHLEVHICDRASGKVVTGAMPTIMLAPSSGGATERLPVAVMQGVAAAGDLHYGNNVALRSGATYTVTVRLGTDRAAFKYTVPRGT